MRVRPPRPAVVPARAGRRRASRGWAWALAWALVLATTLAYAGVPAGDGADAPSDRPADPGLGAVQTALLLVSPAVPSTPAPSGTRPVAALQARQTRPNARQARRGPRRAPPVRLGRAQRWYARRLLEGG